jgi:hypothetical protein
MERMNQEEHITLLDDLDVELPAAPTCLIPGLATPCPLIPVASPRWANDMRRRGA